MKKTSIIGGNIKVFDEGKKRSKYTLDYVIFDPKKEPVTGDDAKRLAATRRKISKAKMKEDFDVIYAQAYKDRMERKKATFFKVCTKAFANCIFVVPKKWKKEAKTVINEYFNFALNS